MVGTMVGVIADTTGDVALVGKTVSPAALSSRSTLFPACVRAISTPVPAKTKGVGTWRTDSTELVEGKLADLLPTTLSAPGARLSALPVGKSGRCAGLTERRITRIIGSAGGKG